MDDGLRSHRSLLSCCLSGRGARFTACVRAREDEMSFRQHPGKSRLWCESEYCPVWEDEEPPADTVTIRETEFP